MGPPFQVNFVRGQRVIQMSASISEDGQFRMIPVMFKDASTPEKPRKNASEEVWARYKEDCNARRLSVRGVECINGMRSHMEKDWDLWVAVDGSYTNQTVLNNLPEYTILIGRIRSDAKLFHLPVISDKTGVGRKRIKLWGVKGLPQPANIPKWQDSNKKYRASTNDLIKQLRSELWADSIISTNLSDFVPKQNSNRSLLNIKIPAFSAVLHVNTG